jgi:hypothetical protein
MSNIFRISALSATRSNGQMARISRQSSCWKLGGMPIRLWLRDRRQESPLNSRFEWVCLAIVSPVNWTGLLNFLGKMRQYGEKKRKQ